MALYRKNANLLRNHALQFATIAHGNQVRKGNEHIPYIFHPVDVANEGIYFSGLPVPELCNTGGLGPAAFRAQGLMRVDRDWANRMELILVSEDFLWALVFSHEAGAFVWEHLYDAV